MVGAFTYCIGTEKYMGLWKNHYSKYYDHIEIMLDDTPPGDNIYEKFHFITPELEKKQSELLKEYNVVSYMEVDEFLIADPDKYKDLREYIDKFQDQKEDMATATGFNVVETPGELPIDWDKPILSQRKYWTKSKFYSKCAMSRVMNGWKDGMANPSGGKPEADPDLYLVHMKYADSGEYFKRGRMRADYKSDEVLKSNLEEACKDMELIPDKFKTWI